MNPATAKARVAEAIKNSRNIVVVPHALAQMEQRKIDHLDIYRCLRDGAIVEGPYIHDIKSGNYRFRVEANVVGEIIAVVAELAECDDGFVIVVTTFKGN